MSESYVQTPDDSANTGKKMRTVSSTIGSDTVHNEGVIVVDPTTPTQVLAVDSSGRITVASIVGALPAGTNAIGKLAANTGVDIGDVDVTSISAGTNNIGEVDIIANTAKDGTGTDYHPLVDTDGHLQIDVLSGGGAGSQYDEDAAHSTGATGTIALVVRQDTATQLADTDADYSVLITDANGRLHVLDQNSAAIKTAVELIDDAIAGSEMQVDVVAALPAGTNAIGKLAANSGVDIGDVDVGGRVAHDSAASTISVPIGGRADSTFQAAVADGDKVDALFDVYGQLRTRVDHANNWSFHSDGSSALTDQQVQAAPGSGLSVYITDIVFSTGAATACNVFFEEGSTKILGPYYLEAVAGRGVSIHFQTPKKCTANTAVTATTSAAIAQALDVTGFIAP